MNEAEDIQTTSLASKENKTPTPAESLG